MAQTLGEGRAMDSCKKGIEVKTMRGIRLI